MGKSEPSSGAMSADSVSYLEDVKKGKPRKFAMVCKGTNVINLVVYKKGNVENRKKEAKEAGTGQFYFGVVDGKGIDIRFALSRADGFESEPVKNSVLKGFLEESAKLKCRPHFEIVDESILMLDEDDPLVARFLKLQEPALAACDAYAHHAAEINGLCRQIGGLLDQDVPDQATIKIDELEKLLAGLSKGAAPPATAPNAAESNESSEAESSEAESSEAESSEAESSVADPMEPLVATMKSLAPLVQAAIQKDAARKDALLGLVAEFKTRVKAQDVAAAKGALTALAQALKQAAATQVAQDTSASPSPGAKDAGAAPKGNSFWPEWELAKSAWQDANDTVNVQLEKLRVELLEVNDDELKRIAEFGLNAITKDQRVPLIAAIMDVDLAKGGDPKAVKDKFAKAKELVSDFRDHLDTDDRVEACDENPFEVKVTIRESLDPALAQMEQTLTKGLAS